MGHTDEVSQLRDPTTRASLAFYKSCSQVQRSNYDALMEELTKWFVPVRIHVIQSSLFHQQKQVPRESVDDYAQGLRKLFNRAYPSTQQGISETESMGRSVLAYQFVAGLRHKNEGGWN